MRLCLSLCLSILLCFAGAAVFAADLNESSENVGEWTVPDCDFIKGTISVTYTMDDGATVFDPKPGSAEVATPGLVVLDVDNTLMASIYDGYGIEIVRSEDAGCNWTSIEVPHMRRFLELTPAPGGWAYAWYMDTDLLFRIEGDTAIALTPPDMIYGLAVDPRDALHIRIGGTDCQIYESFDGGETFSPIGNPANTAGLRIFTVDFNPQDWDCALCGTKGAWRTIDAGKNWGPIDPFDAVDGDFVYSFAFSPDDPRRVWARATLTAITLRSPEILISSDGGLTFVGAVKDGDLATDQFGEIRDVVLRNYMPLAPRPGQPDVIYFPFGTFVGARGSDLFRYDARDGELSVKHVSNIFDDITSIAFHPADPTVMYLGIQVDHPKATNPGIEATGDAVSVYPNPFNPSANISFSLPEAAQVKLSVYNLVGQRVATVVDAYMSAGEHTASWDAAGFASGIYLARLEAGSFIETQKMVLLK